MALTKEQKRERRRVREGWGNGGVGGSARNAPLRERFFKAVRRHNSGCHFWQGGLAGNGYGKITHQYRTISAHRMAWILAHGDEPIGKMVLHSCDNKRCVNPAHLFLGNAQINAWDMTNKGRAKGGGRCIFKKNGKYRLAIQVAGHTVHLGTYRTQAEAREALAEVRRTLLEVAS